MMVTIVLLSNRIKSCFFLIVAVEYYGIREVFELFGISVEAPGDGGMDPPWLQYQVLLLSNFAYLIDVVVLDL